MTSRLSDPALGSFAQSAEVPFGRGWMGAHGELDPAVVTGAGRVAWPREDDAGHLIGWGF